MAASKGRCIRRSRSRVSEPKPRWHISSDLVGVHACVGIIKQNTVCEAVGDDSTEVERNLKILKGHHDIVPPSRVEGIPDVQGDDGTHPLGTTSTADRRFSQADDSTGSVDCRSGFSETELIVS